MERAQLDASGEFNVSQVKIYGMREHLDPVKKALSDVIHSCVVGWSAFKFATSLPHINPTGTSGLYRLMYYQ